MDSFITYLFQSTICLTTFLIFYFFVLRKETFHLENRIFLLITCCFSILVPFLKFGWPVTSYTKEITLYMAPVLVTGKTLSGGPGFNLMLIPQIIYFSVLIALLIIFILKIGKLFYLIKNNETVVIKGQKIVIIDTAHSPFSFFNRIFMTRDQMSEESLDKIIAHEKTHIEQLHTIDIILLELVKIVHWFNPLAWKFKKEIEAQHEFLADSELISSGINLNEYKHVLMSYSFGTNNYAVTNNFNSLLKRRFEMLSTTKSGTTGKVKLLFTLPVMVFLIMVIGIVNGSISFTSAKVNGDDKVYSYADQMPEYPGGVEKMTEFIINNIKYPESAKEKGIMGKVYVQMVIDIDGSITDIKVAKGFNADCDAEAIRVVKLMPKWIPGKENGKPVKVRISIPIAFALK